MGMPVGSDLEYVDEVTMDKALDESTRDVNASCQLAFVSQTNGLLRS